MGKKFTHIFVIGQDCASVRFARWIDESRLGRSPQMFTLLDGGIQAATKMVCARGERVFDIRDFAMVWNRKDYGPVIKNLRTGQVFPHDWWPLACKDWNVVLRDYSKLKNRMDNFCAGFYKVLDNANNNVLFVYLGYGSMYETYLGYGASCNTTPWYDLDSAKECAEKLNSTFNANTTLLYLDIPEREEDRLIEITHVDDHLIAATHRFSPSSLSFVRADSMMSFFADKLRNLLGDGCFRKLTTSPEEYLISAKHPNWADILCINPVKMFGKRCNNGDAFDIKHVDDDKLSVKWRKYGWETFTFNHSIDFPVWKLTESDRHVV